MPVIQVKGYFSKAAFMLRMGLGLGMRTLWAPVRWKVSRFTVKAKMW